MKRQPTDEEKYICQISDEVLIYKIYKELKKVNTKRTSDLINKWGKSIVQFSKEVQIAKECMKKIINILSHKGNSNQDYNEIPPHPSKNGCHQENKQGQCSGSCLLTPATQKE
jgi:hypothetical protein